MKADSRKAGGWRFAVQAKAATGGQSIELDIYDVVGKDDMMSAYFDDRVSAKSIRAKLAEFPGATEINVRINSAGGDVFDGMAIYSLLKEQTSKVVVQVDGLCASIASIIAMAGTEIRMHEGTWMMIHDPYYAYILTEMREADLRTQADALAKMSDSMATIYAARSGQKKEDCAAAMKATTWMTAAEAKALGYCTEIIPAKAGESEDEKADEESTAMVAALVKDFPRVPTGAFFAMARAHEAMNMIMQANAAAKPAVVTAPPAKAEGDDDKDEKIKNLEAKVSDLEAKVAEFEKKGDKDEEEPDEEGKALHTALVAAASAITGEKDPKRLEGALYALEARMGKPADAKAERGKLVSKLIAEGKLAPARKVWALEASDTAIEGYLAGIGSQRVAPIGVEHQPNDAAAALQAGTTTNASAVALTKEEKIVAVGLGLKEADVLAEKVKRVAAQSAQA